MGVKSKIKTFHFRSALFQLSRHFKGKVLKQFYKGRMLERESNLKQYKLHNGESPFRASFGRKAHPVTVRKMMLYMMMT